MKAKAENGSMLMEYVILLGGMAVFAVSISLSIWDFQSPWGGSFGSLAVPFVHLCQRIVAMISLPFP